MILTSSDKCGHTRETSAIPLCAQPPSGELKNALLKQAAHARQYPGHEDSIIVTPCWLTCSIRPYINSSW